MENFTNQEIENCRAKIREIDRKNQEKEALQLSENLQKFFETTLRTHYKVKLSQGEWYSSIALAQVCELSVKSLSDFRHRYPHTIMPFKYLSIIMFWVVKLKPVNGLAMQKDNDWIDCPDINERLALKYMEYAVWSMLKENKIPEFLEDSKQNKDSVKKIFKVFFEDQMYSNEGQSTDSGLQRNNKGYETSYYMRFKKMTAINIYESLTHLLLPLKSGFHPN